MKTSTWSLQRVLAWAWVACLGLLWLTAHTPLRFNSRPKHLLVLWMAWLFFAPAMFYLAARTARPGRQRLLRWLPRVQWAGLGVLFLLWVPCLLMVQGQPPLWAWFFPVDDPDYARAHPLLSRGRAEHVYEVNDDPQNGRRDVRVRFLPALLVWVTPQPPASLDSTWTLRSANGADLLAPRYRMAAQYDLDRRPDGAYLYPSE
jgi:hypothetical protein